MGGASLQPEDLLHWAITAPKAGVARFLIEHGVQSENVDEERNTPLFDAIKYCAHDCLDMVLARGVNTGHVNSEGATILHWAARHGDMSVLEIMRRWPFRRVDVRKMDGMGRTVMQVLAELVKSVEDVNVENCGEEECFFDARDELAARE